MISPTVNYKRLKFLMGFASVLLVCVVAAAQNGIGDLAQEEVPAVQPIDQSTQVQDENSAQEQAVITPLQQRMLKTISIDCINTPIEDVIRMMSEQAKVDIIKSPNVTGNVTATLTNVPLAEALDNILAVHGYGCVIDKNMIRIAPIDEIAQKGEILNTRVYRITYADVTQVENALKKFISKRGSISSNPGTSNIIVTDTGSAIKAIDTFIDEIDRITPQVMVEVRIYDITSTDDFDIGAEWTVGRNNPITTFGTNKEDTTVDNITGAKTDVTTISKTKQTAWSGTGTPVAFRKSNPFIGGEFNADTGGTLRFALLDSVNLELALNVLRKEVGAKLLANPSILVLDNETADFKIISEIPYLEQSDTSAGGSLTSIQFKDVGVELKVTPHVTRGDMVRMHIIPEFSVVAEKGLKDANSALGTVPTVDTRKMDTKALVKDGQSVVLGGLRKRTVSQTVNKIPLLGDVPILGCLFSNISEEVKTNELLIFITPKIVIEPTLSPKERDRLGATDFGDPRLTITGDEKAEAERAKKAEAKPDK